MTTDTATKRLMQIMVEDMAYLLTGHEALELLGTIRQAIANDPSLIEAIDPWRPIETAPKDGSYVLLSSNQGFDVAHWNTRRSRWETGYICADNGMFTVDYPTHYMPLRTTPTTEDKS